MISHNKKKLSQSNIKSELKIFSREIKTNWWLNTRTNTQVLFIVFGKDHLCLSQNPLLFLPACLQAAGRRGRGYNVRGHRTEMFDPSFTSQCVPLFSTTSPSLLQFPHQLFSFRDMIQFRMKRWISAFKPVCAL